MSPKASSRPSFVVPLRDLDDGPKTLAAEITVEWLCAALEGTEATPAGSTGTLSAELSKNGREVLVRGSARVDVVVPCARTLAPITLALEPEIFLLLGRADQAPERGRARGAAPAGGPTAARVRAASRASRQRDGQRGEHRPRDRGVRPARSGARGAWTESPELTSADAAQDVFEGEQIVLDAFLREFILLELPMFPVRQDLPSLPVEARASAPVDPAGKDAKDSAADAAPIDPRLAPLVELKDRLRKQKVDKE